MRNKITALLLVLVTVLSLTGCAVKTDVLSTPLPTEKIESESSENTPEVLNTKEAVKTPDATPVTTEKVSVRKTEKPSEEKKEELYCSIKIDCSNILNNLDEFDENKLMLLNDNGIIYSNSKVKFNEGETAFDVVLRELKNNGIHFEYTFSVAQNSCYIEGINNIYELDCGSMSGWMYCVNGVYPNCSLGDYKLKNGDSIAINYTCDMGEDLGRKYN